MCSHIKFAQYYVYIYEHIMTQCLNSHPLVMVPVSITLMVATTRSFIAVCSCNKVLYPSDVESTKVVFLEKSSSFIVFLCSNWETCYSCGVVTLSVCLVPLELIMYTKHVYQLQRSNGYHVL